jgi:hypothetical protein
MGNYYNLKPRKAAYSPTHKSRNYTSRSRTRNAREKVSKTRNQRQSSEEMFDGLRRKLKKISNLRNLDRLQTKNSDKDLTNEDAGI